MSEATPPSDTSSVCHTMLPPLQCISPRMLPEWPCLRTLFTHITLESPWSKRAAPSRTAFSPSMAIRSSPRALYTDNWALQF
eukprot:2954343-Prorocentrum_lima.AAC.1